MSEPTATPDFVPRYTTLLQALDAAADSPRNRIITVLGERPDDPDVRVSYAELRQRVDAMASALHALDIAVGEPVLLVLPTGVDFLVAFFACQRLRAVPVPAYPPAGLRMDAGLERLSHIARHAHIRRCVTIRAYAPLLNELAQQVEGLHVFAAEDLSAASAHAAFPVAQPGDPAFVQFTSGSTGRPKGVVLSHANLTANVHAIGLALELTPEDMFVNWCPLYHDMGLIGNVLTSVCWELSLVLMSPTAFIRHPARWLRAIHTHRGTITTAPNFAFGLALARVNGKRREGLDLSTWRVACNGAEPVNAATIEAFAEAYAPYGYRPETMLPVYGLAEASLAVAFPKVSERPRYDHVERGALARGHAVPVSPDAGGACFVSVGRAVPGHRIRIVQRDTEVGERCVGDVEVAGPSVMNGYLRDEAATASTRSGEWLRTGDLGYFAGGELFIVGRSKDVIIVRGQNIHPEDIERTVDEVPGVRSGNAVAFGVYDEAAAEERVVIVAEYAQSLGDGGAALVQRIRDAVGRNHTVTLADVRLVSRGEVPKTSSGKRQRAECRARYLAGELELPRSARSAAEGAGPDALSAARS